MTSASSATIPATTDVAARIIDSTRGSLPSVARPALLPSAPSKIDMGSAAAEASRPAIWACSSGELGRQVGHLLLCVGTACRQSVALGLQRLRRLFF